MKRYIVLFITIVFIICILGACCSGSETSNDGNTTYADNPMFITIVDARDYRVVYHKDTKVMYAISEGSYNRGTFTLLVDADNKPLLYKED